MRPRKTLSTLTKWGLYAFALSIDLLHIGFAIISFIPVAGLIGTVGGVITSFISFAGFGVWATTVSVGFARMQAWVIGTLAIFGLQLFSSMVPFFGEVVAVLLSFWVTWRMYVFIKKIERDDAEYNKKHGLI